MDTTQCNQKYIDMQRETYVKLASNLGFDNAQYLVGPKWTFDDSIGNIVYQLLFGDIKTEDKIALDFGCGVGRMIGWFNNRFQRIDGVDLSEQMLEYAKEYLARRGISGVSLTKCNGYDLRDFPSVSYDIIYSGWVLQHICVFTIRDSYFKEFYRLLKPGGYLCIQMEGGDNPDIFGSELSEWNEDVYDADGTNGAFDVKVNDIFKLTRYLHGIGFRLFNYVIEKRVDPYNEKMIGQEFNIFIRAQKWD